MQEEEWKVGKYANVKGRHIEKERCRRDDNGVRAAKHPACHNNNGNLRCSIIANAFCNGKQNNSMRKMQ